MFIFFISYAVSNKLNIQITQSKNLQALHLNISKLISTGCKTDANPTNLTYKWYINEESINGNTTELVSAFEVSESK